MVKEILELEPEKFHWGHLLDVWSWESQLNSVNFHFTCKLGTIMFFSLWSESCAVVSNSFWPHGLYSPWTSPGQNTGVGSLSLLQGIFPTQGPNPGLLHCGQILYQLSHKGSPRLLEWVVYPLSSPLPNPGIEPGSPALQVGSLPPELSGEPLSHHPCMLSCFSHVWLFATLWTAARQAPCGFQARTLESVALLSSKGAFQPRDPTSSLTSPTLARGFFTTSK